MQVLLSGGSTLMWLQHTFHVSCQAGTGAVLFLIHRTRINASVIKAPTPCTECSHDLRLHAHTASRVKDMSASDLALTNRWPGVALIKL